jgi:chorismate lyase/3-hydroxybenzoate synthase
MNETRLPFVEFNNATEATMRFVFAKSGTVPCAYLAGNPAPECWHSSSAFAWRLLHHPESGDLVADSKAIYAELLQQVRPSTHPHLLRIWNYLPEINLGAEDAERYRQFCVGRAQAVDAAFNSPPPAATAIGSSWSQSGLQLIALCAKTPAIALENPRQTPAWQYPRQYGQVAPGFSRGALLHPENQPAILLVSGTASIVGHASMHSTDVAEQCRESLRNLRALLDEGEKHSAASFTLAACQALRVYVRDPAQLAAVQAVFAGSSIPPHAVVYLQGDICRRELAVELEGVFNTISIHA